MTPAQAQAFQDAAGFAASGLRFEIRLMVGGLALVCALFILVGLMHLLNSNEPWDKMMFLLSIFGLSFILMLIFTYCA
jgi:hypothetical protein